jgi:S-adenosylmethionine hydrolase
MQPPITLLTDFTQKDGFVAVMKGVILSIEPSATIVDMSHDISPQNITEAAFVLQTSYRFFPVSTIHVIVVDPGVGSSRRIICMDTGDYRFLAPDNGVLTMLLQEHANASVFNVTEQRYFLKQVSQTFHGRDIFAPVAAHLLKGCRPDELGPKIDDYTIKDVRAPQTAGGRIHAQVAHIDRFGNIITNMPVNRINRANFKQIDFCGSCIANYVDSYSESPPGLPFVIPGSSGFLEIAMNKQRAADRFTCKPGDSLTVYLHSD